MNEVEYVSTPSKVIRRGDVFLTREATTAILTEYNARWFLINLIDGSIARTELTKAQCVEGARKLEIGTKIILAVNQVED